MGEACIDRISRRRLVQGGACAALATYLGRSAWASADPQHLAKPIGSAAERLPVIGLGTDSFASRDYPALRDEIQRMVELGGTLIDTAPAYGESEALIGRALEELKLRDRVFIATKLTARNGGYYGNNPVGKDSLLRSLERLRTTHIDLLQVHNLNGVEILMPWLRQWKQDGKIRYLGITTSQVEQHVPMAEYLRTMPLDFVQVDYSIAERDAEASVLPLAQQHHVAVLANLPFGHASLFRQAGKRSLPPWAAQLGISSWAQYFLKYVVSHPAVTAAIPGSTSVAHLVDNQGAGRGAMPDAAQRQNMERYWAAAG